MIYEIDSKRYDELIAKEERLRLLENAIKKEKGYTDITSLKNLVSEQEDKE